MSLLISNIQIANTERVSTPSRVTTPSQVTSAQKGKPQKLSAKEEAAENLKMRVLQILDLKDNFIKVSIEIKNNRYGIKLTRPANDRRRTDERYEFSNGTIKDKLGIKDGVLKKYNDLRDVTGRQNLHESAGATMEPGKSLFIPLCELGRDFAWFSSNKDIKEYVQKYLNAKQ